MDTGQLRQYVTIESRSVTRDSFGEIVEAWNLFANVYAKVEPVGAVEDVKMVATHKVTIRYLDGLLPTMRVLFRNRTLHITSIVNVNEADTWVELLCREFVA